jgi:dihydroflavonol-4-reductase
MAVGTRTVPNAHDAAPGFTRRRSGVTVLVTGSDGLLGSNLVRELLGRGLAVRALVHPSSRSDTLEGLAIERYRGDILDRASLEGAMAGCTGVFHCAASTALWPPRDPRITIINLDGTRNVIDVAQRCGISRLVHVGTANSFGFGSRLSPGTEESPYGYRGFGLAYSDSKLAAQRLVIDRAEKGLIDAVVVNPTFMLGPYDSGPGSGRMIVGFTELRPWFYPPGGRNFVHVRDVAAGMASAFERGRTAECYILGHENLSIQELFAMIAGVAGVRPPSVKAPAWLVVIAGLAGSLRSAITRSPPDLTYEMARMSCLGTYYSPAKAVRELGLPQTPVQTAIEDAYRWFADRGYIRLTS